MRRPSPLRAGHPARRVRPTRSFLALAAGTLGLALAVGLAPVAPRLAAADPSAPADASTPPGSPPAPAASDALPEGFGTWLEALAIVRDHYVDADALDDRNLVEGSIRGLVEALGDDGHTVYLTADELTAEQEALDGTLSGIGVMVDERTGGPMIVTVIDGSPAERAGLRPGDRILAVDGHRTDRSSVDELVRRVRGEEGTPVRLRIRRADGSTATVTIVRQRIAVEAVDWAFAPGTRTAVVRLVQFSSGVGPDVAEAVREALEAGASRIVLDLRGNPGGLVTEAVAVASVFLDDGVVYLQEGRDGDRESIGTVGDAIVPDLPMVVLVDGGSASAAEIVASSLQAAGRALLVGTRTFGTGTVLNVFPLTDGSAIRLGVQRWLTPDGRGVFETGVRPDVRVTLPPQAVPLDPGEFRDRSAAWLARAGDTQLRRALRLLAGPTPPRVARGSGG
jgi:carboxyl-terminal processing protease